ncbi:potassium channel family protein [Nocardioides pacificus]
MVDPSPHATVGGRQSGPGRPLAHAATLVGLLALFFSMPVTAGEPVVVLLRSGSIALLGVVLVAWIVVRQLRGSGRRELGPLQLVMLAEIVACAFALAYYVLATQGDHVAGVHTRLDALYFTLTTMTTVGYGDVRATSQLARGIVCVQLAFNLAFLGALARLIQHRLGAPRG